MKTATKTTVILTSVLLLGIIIGFFGASSWVHYNQKKRFGHFRKGEGFVIEMEKLIDPTPEQKDQVHQILTRHSMWVKQFSEEQRTIFRKSLDSLDTELAQVLTPEQMQRLKEKINKRPRNPGPPPPPEEGQRPAGLPK
jgi:Spy/CpxP family protein refolding chaperone